MSSIYEKTVFRFVLTLDELEELFSRAKLADPDTPFAVYDNGTAAIAFVLEAVPSRGSQH